MELSDCVCCKSSMYYSIKKHHPFYSTLLSLSLLGLYPRSASPSNSKISLTITVGTVVLALIICNIGAIGHLIISFKGSRGAEISEDMAVAIGGLGFLMCVSFFRMRWTKWTKFWKKLTNFSDYGKPGDFDIIKDRCNIMSLIYSFYIAGGMCVYAATSILEMDCADLQEKNNLCGTLTQIWLPIGKVSSFAIKVIFFFQWLVCIWACVGAGNIFFVSFESTEFVVCHINYLKVKILEIFKNDDENIRKRELRVCVTYHKRIIEMGNDLNYLVKSTLGHMSLIAAVVMGMIANQIVQKYKPLGAGIYLGGYIFAVFWLSHAGQRITDESLSVADAVSESDWYKGSNEIRKDLAFITRRSHEPLIIRALPLGTFNYTLFITMLKASYSYLTLLQQSVSTEDS